MRNMIFAGTLMLLLACQSAAQVIDNQEDSIELIADRLCQGGESSRISRASTIGPLYDHLSSSSNAACRDRYLKPLGALKKVLETSSATVCSSEKIKAIEEFHWAYIVGSLSKKWRHASEKSLPEPLRLFFMHYAHDVAEMCKQTLYLRLSRAVEGKNVHPSSDFLSKLRGSLDELSLTVVPESKVKNYDTFILIWNQLIDKEKRKGHPIPETIDALTGEPVVGLMKTKDPSNAWAIQRQCRHELRPIYKETVLPVMRLLELGYGLVDADSKREVEANDEMRSWYAAAQICELVVPISFYRDESMKPGKASVLWDEKLAEGLGRPTDVVSVEKIQHNVHVVNIKLKDICESAANDGVVNQVKAKLRERGHLFRQVIKNIFANARGGFRSKFRNLSLFRKKKNDDSFLEESGDEFLNESKAEVEELLADDEDSVGLAQTKQGVLKRNKRTVHTVAHYGIRIAIFIVVALIVGAVVFGFLTLIG